MKANLRLLFTILFGLVFSNSSNLSNPIDSSFLSVTRFGSKQLTIDYFLDVDSGFDDISKQTITELLENSIQVVSYLLQEIPSAILPTTSSNPLCLEFNQLTSSQISSSDIILLVANDKETKKSLSFEDCSSATYPQKLGLIKVSMPLLLKENNNSTIFKVVENLSKNYIANTNILRKLDSLFNTNLGISCTSSCKVCDSSSGACITCYDATHMEIKNGICYCTDPNAAFFPPTNSCVCMNGYYLNSTNVCAPCPTICASCTSSTSCLSCISPTEMTFYNNWCYCTNPEGSVFNSISKNCNCPNGTWNDGRYCQACNETCSSCTNQDTCTSCIDTTNMNLIQGTCSCKDPSSSLNPASGLCECQAGYYMENSICYACQPPCKTCINSTFCSSCLGSNMTLADGICSCPANSTFSLADGVCHCKIGYFLDQSQVCQSCFLGCATCNDSLCLSCMDPGAMTIQNGVCSCRFPGAYFNSTTNKCDCPLGMFRNGSECFSCSDGCLSCTSETECLSCFEPSEVDYPYSLISGSCECLYNNSFSDGSNGCSCLEGYYLTQDKLQCLDCPDGCLTCSSFNGFCGQNQSVCCLSCVDPRMFINSNGLCQCGLSNSYFSPQLKSCQCNGGYYLNNDTCSLCSLPCGNCTTDPLNCTSCALPDQMTLLNNTCSCTSPSSSIYDLKLNECICPIGKYLNNTSCDICPATCMSCESSTNCLSCVDPIHMTIGSNGICTCPKNSTFDGEACVCNNNYFWRGLECTYCKSPCNKCVNQTFCLSCMDPNNFALKNGECRCRDPNAHFNNLEDSCVCNDGYFMVNSACRACQVTCSTCENSIACTGCIDKDYMNLINGICACNDTNASFISSQKKCVCNQGYQLVNSVCIECPVECSACSSSNVCTQCVNPEEMTVISGACICNGNNTIYDSFSNSCICKEKYYYYGNECVACQSPLCAKCENNRCLSCIDPVNMDLSCEICSCSDPNSYFNTSSGFCECLHDFEPNLIGNTLQCIPLSSPCREFSVDGLCLKCADNSMELYKGQCYCLDPNASYNYTTQNCTCNFGYQLTTYSKLCQPCDSYLYGGIMGCINCNNGKCLECEKGLKLYNKMCNCNFGLVWNNFLGACFCTRGNWNSAQCPPCGCYSCSANGTCLEPCSQNSTWINGKCKCNNGFYECSPNQCCTMSRTCTSLANGKCNSCISNMYLSDQQCKCPGYAYDSQLNKCVPGCSLLCNNCSSNSICLSCQAPFFAQNENCVCDPNAIQSWNTCICKDGYYMNSTFSCLPCPENCATCISATTCTSCRDDFVLVNKNCLCSDFNAIYNSQISQCECSTGYYSKGFKCEACLKTCYGCLGDGTTCTSCADENNMILNEGVCSCIDPNAVFNSTTLKCECPYGYYNSICSACGPGCSKCSYNQCLSCYDSAHMTLVGNSCTCLDPNAYYVEWAKICTCKSGFYYNGQICVPTARN